MDILGLRSEDFESPRRLSYPEIRSALDIHRSRMTPSAISCELPFGRYTEWRALKKSEFRTLELCGRRTTGPTKFGLSP